jgi:hypothetical protein
MSQSQSKAALRNVVAFLLGPALIAILIAFWVKANPPDFAHPSQAAALGITTLAPILILGALGVWASIYSGMAPDPLRTEQGWRPIMTAVASGIVLGLIAISLDVATGFSDQIARRLEIPSIHISFPASAYVYAAGAIAVECLYRLIPIGLLYFLIAQLAFRGRAESAVFWTLAVATSLIEPLSQAALANDQLLVWLLFGVIFTFNMVEALLWRHYGWVALLMSRLLFYLVWHVAIGPSL